MERAAWSKSKVCWLMPPAGSSGLWGDSRAARHPCHRSKPSPASCHRLALPRGNLLHLSTQKAAEPTRPLRRFLLAPSPALNTADSLPARPRYLSERNPPVSHHCPPTADPPTPLQRAAAPGRWAAVLCRLDAASLHAGAQDQTTSGLMTASKCIMFRNDVAPHIAGVHHRPRSGFAQEIFSMLSPRDLGLAAQVPHRYRAVFWGVMLTLRLCWICTPALPR